MLSVISNDTNLRSVLEELYESYNARDFIPPDPLQFLYRYEDARNCELVGYLSSVLAYGRVAQIEKSLSCLLHMLGSDPITTISDRDGNLLEQLKTFKHRFNTGADIANLLRLLAVIYDEYANLEQFFIRGYRHKDSNLLGAMQSFHDRLSALHRRRIGHDPTPSFLYLVPGPAKGSACKRMCMFLRWMIRRDQVDPGLWHTISPNKLLVPLDVHMGRITRLLGMHKRASIDLQTVVQVTKAFHALDAQDPVKYDFALSRVGILDGCSGTVSSVCPTCSLTGICMASQK